MKFYSALNYHQLLAYCWLTRTQIYCVQGTFEESFYQHSIRSVAAAFFHGRYTTSSSNTAAAPTTVTAGGRKCSSICSCAFRVGQIT